MISSRTRRNTTTTTNRRWAAFESIISRVRQHLCDLYAWGGKEQEMGVVHLIWCPLIHQRAKSLSLWIWPEKRKSISAHNSSTSLLALISYYTVKKKENVEQHKIKSMLFLAFTIKKRLNHQLKWSHFSACMRQRELTGPQSTATEYSVI